MSGQKGIQIRYLKLTDEQTTAALQRASENAKSWVVWKDTRAPQQGQQQLKQK